jgi:hypothetical protein
VNGNKLFSEMPAPGADIRLFCRGEKTSADSTSRPMLVKSYSILIFTVFLIASGE